MTKRVLITGAGGFAGHHYLEHVLKTTDWDIVATDSFRHKGKTDRISEVLANGPVPLIPGMSSSWHRRVKIITHDLTAPFSNQAMDQIGDIDYIVAYASESHVDRSITDPVPFFRNNTDVALTTMELARTLRPKAVVLVSTDEVYGPVEEGNVTGLPEWSPILPSNPYAASKAAQEALAISYWRTFDVPLIIVNSMNMYGERQDTEKFIPLVIGKVLRGETVQVHGTPGHIGTRHYLHARNLASGINFLLDKTTPAKFPAHTTYEDGDLGRVWKHRTSDRPNRYNIASGDRIDNLTLARMIAEFVGKPLKSVLRDFHSARPGHDPHYGLDPTKIHDLGWKMPVPFAASLERTVRWTLDHPSWLLHD